MDLASEAPTIGRATAPHLGRLNADTPLRPPAIALDGTTAGTFRVAAASMIGTGHLASGHPRQDAYNFMVGDSGRLYIAVADGLGSRPVSQLGSHLFAESVLLAAAEAEDAGTGEPDPAALLRQASRRTAELVEGVYGQDPRAAGFVGAVAVITEAGGRLARIGDVSAFSLVDGEFAELFAADEGLVNIVTASMPGEREEEIELVDVPPAPVLVLGTDGLANDLRNSGNLRAWLGERWRVPHLPFGVGDALRYRRQGSHDDRTAVVVWRGTPPTAPSATPVTASPAASLTASATASPTSSLTASPTASFTDERGASFAASPTASFTDERGASFTDERGASFTDERGASFTEERAAFTQEHGGAAGVGNADESGAEQADET
ncbi:protein phosphatase 2C domain-containing protein [Actinoplanes ianthinogenes]|uniref:protein phosphatase 2C domain-containing protein n=1 Tax=Actinoplanes ianthinogenes TaxID=122358 RepID=UPI00167000F5|nr:protein phosphatase 2C domain-containing protein [Actinoplanes ianthinogenes]